MDELLHKKLQDAVWAAHSLFERGKTSGSCFGTLTEEDFAMVTLDGTPPERQEGQQRVYAAQALLRKGPRHPGGDPHPRSLCGPVVLPGL